MKFNDFVESLTNAGWEGVHDAQHEYIKQLWKTIFPVIAELEEEVEHLQEEVNEFIDCQPKL